MAFRGSHGWLTPRCLMIPVLNAFGLTLALLGGANASTAPMACLGDASQAAQPLSVAVVPQLPQKVSYARWAPLLEIIGHKTGQCFDLIIPPSIPEFEKILYAGEPDFAFANPYHMVVAKREQGYIPLVIDARNKLTGLVVVKADSPIRNIQGLEGQVVAFPAPNAFAASLLIRAELAKQGIHIQPKYVKTHANGYRAVAVGDAVAAGGVNNTLKRENAGLQEVLRVLYETPGYTPHPFAAHPRVSAEIRQAVTDAFLALGSDPANKKLLTDIQIPAPKVANYQRDFVPLELLNLESFTVNDAN